jgi:hypothetical protein
VGQARGSVDATFVVRVKRDGGGRLRGVIERVKTGEKHPFDSAEGVVAVLARMMRVAAPTPGPKTSRSQR